VLGFCLRINPSMEKTDRGLACCATFSTLTKSIQITEHTCTHRNAQKSRRMNHLPPSHSPLIPIHCTLPLEVSKSRHLLECPGTISCLVVIVVAKFMGTTRHDSAHDCALFYGNEKTVESTHVRDFFLSDCDMCMVERNCRRRQ
jgi:hypothetical protein